MQYEDNLSNLNIFESPAEIEVNCRSSEQLIQLNSCSGFGWFVSSVHARVLKIVNNFISKSSIKKPNCSYYFKCRISSKFYEHLNFEGQIVCFPDIFRYYNYKKRKIKVMTSSIHASWIFYGNEIWLFDPVIIQRILIEILLFSEIYFDIVYILGFWLNLKS